MGCPQNLVRYDSIARQTALGWAEIGHQVNFQLTKVSIATGFGDFRIAGYVEGNGESSPVSGCPSIYV
jgi:hypothetical protein